MHLRTKFTHKHNTINTNTKTAIKSPLKQPRLLFGEILPSQFGADPVEGVTTFLPLKFPCKSELVLSVQLVRASNIDAGHVPHVDLHPTQF